MKNETKRTSDLSILYVESDIRLQQEISIHLKKIFSKVYQSFNGLDAIRQYTKNKPDIVLTDLNISNKNGFEMIVDMQDLDSKVSIIVLSKKNDDFELLETLDLGIIALLQKPLNLTNLNRALQKVILLKPNKIIPPKVIPSKPILKPKTKPIVLTPIQTKKVVQQPIKIKPVITKPIPIIPIIKEPIKKKPTKNKPVTVVQKEIVNTQCNDIITSAITDALSVECVNSFKGLIIGNNGEIIKLKNNLFTLQVSKVQLFSIIYEKQIIIGIKDKYILAKLFRVDKKSAQVILKNPQFIQFKQRDNNNKRLTVDKSFKATVGYDNVQIELIPCDVSYDYIALETTEHLDLQENNPIELTMGFEIDSPSSLIKEKKFTKVFATGTIKRMHNNGDKQKIIIEHKIQKSGQNVYKKYLQQREITIINEFKMKMKS